MAGLHERGHAVVRGKIVAITYPSDKGALQLNAHLKDDTGTIIVAWPGRRDIPGVAVGTEIIVEGNVSYQHAEKLLWNPNYQIISVEQ